MPAFRVSSSMYHTVGVTRCRGLLPGEPFYSLKAPLREDAGGLRQKGAGSRKKVLAEGLSIELLTRSEE